jgi:hypothetical protein
MLKKCAQCGKKMEVEPSSRKIYCSDTCRCMAKRRRLGAKPKPRKRKNAVQLTTWTTSHELAFIDGLGSYHGPTRPSPSYPRDELLAWYIKFMSDDRPGLGRKNFGRINREKAIAYAKAAYDEEMLNL